MSRLTLKFLAMKMILLLNVYFPNQILSQMNHMEKTLFILLKSSRQGKRKVVIDIQCYVICKQNHKPIAWKHCATLLRNISAHARPVWPTNTLWPVVDFNYSSKCTRKCHQVGHIIPDWLLHSYLASNFSRTRLVSPFVPHSLMAVIHTHLKNEF